MTALHKIAPRDYAPSEQSAQDARGTDATPAQGAVFDPHARAFHDRETGEIVSDLAAWDRATEREREQARVRLAIARHAEDLIAAGLSRLDADEAAGTAAGVKPSAVGVWRRKIAPLPEGARVAALLDRKSPGRPRRIEAQMMGELEALVATFGEHLTSLQAVDVLEARYGHAPSRTTVRRWLARIRRERAHALSAVSNPDRHRSHRKPAGGNASANVERLNQLWELDSTLADVICADGKRYAIVAALDIWSRRARVLVVPTSRATAIAALLRRCILEWGVPEIVRTDEGKDYTSHHVTGVLADLEIDHAPCLPYTPEAKPHVERFLGTLARDLFALLPGFTGHDVAQAQALRARKSFAARQGADKCKTFGVALTVEELQARCDDWCRDRYERRPHAGLNGVAPFDRANEWAEPVRKVHDVRALDTLLAEPAGEGWRTVRKEGIRLGGLDYIAGPLGKLVKERVRILCDPTRPGRIHVYHGKAFVCVAVCPALTGDDQAEIAARMVAEWKGANKAARKWARDLKRRHRPESAMDDVLDHARDKAGRVVALPRKPHAHETPALKEAARAAEAAAAIDSDDPATPRPMRKALAAAGHFFDEEE